VHWGAKYLKERGKNGTFEIDYFNMFNGLKKKAPTSLNPK
jgi:hypothetical protein